MAGGFNEEERQRLKRLSLPPELKDFHLLKSAFKNNIAHYKFFFPDDTVRPSLLFF